jgi:hypothetical protein
MGLAGACCRCRSLALVPMPPSSRGQIPPGAGADQSHHAPDPDWGALVVKTGSVRLSEFSLHESPL